MRDLTPPDPWESLDPLLVRYALETFGNGYGSMLLRATVLLTENDSDFIQDKLLELIYMHETMLNSELADKFRLTIENDIKAALELLNLELKEGATPKEELQILTGAFEIIRNDLSEEDRELVRSEDIEDYDLAAQLLDGVMSEDYVNISELLEGTGTNFRKIVEKKAKDEIEIEPETGESESESPVMQQEKEWLVKYLEFNYSHTVGMFLLDYGLEVGKTFQAYLDFLDLLDKDYRNPDDLFSVLVISQDGNQNPLGVLQDHIETLFETLSDQQNTINAVNQMVEEMRDGYSRRHV